MKMQISCGTGRPERMENQSEQILLDVQNLHTCFYGRRDTVHAVNGVSFKVSAGEILGIVGESGCGKSATCRSVIRLLPRGGEITEGTIDYCGIDLAQKDERYFQRIRGREIGMIFQEPMNTLNPVTTIGEQLMETMRGQEVSREKKKEKAVELLKMVGIPSPEERLMEYAHQFSGGMRQRAMIAIALAAGPKLLIADEPTTALDVTVQQQIIRLLLSLRDRLGMGMIFVTHDLGAASEICDNIAVMYAGRIVEQAPAEELFQNPQHPYTMGLMRSIPSAGRRGEKLTPIPGSPPDLRKIPKGCAFASRCPYAEDNCKSEPVTLREYNAKHCFFCHKESETRG